MCLKEVSSVVYTEVQDDNCLNDLPVHPEHGAAQIFL